MSRARSQGCSSCSCGSENHNVSCPPGWCGSSDGSPTCYCGEIAVLKVARTMKNGGKQFWGCPNYKRSANEGFKGCNYFKWCNEENVDERNATIGRQSKTITDLEKVVIDYEKWVNFLIGMIFFWGSLTSSLYLRCLKFVEVI
ncbi:hypothetical protein DEO72_LG5g1410 [Vigna unguiculata]|uniref:GRF-type domain-containing protein n=1 Tax=Vigna unguiculata TaxID=3917 RepID=A0A4D6LXC5_VIGUN|nr:hypothetical protein DEO72_LG5g1410 [Vigna unguiculata]